MTHVLELAIPAEAGAPSRARRAVAEWLSGLCGLAALCETAEDLTYAVSEAVANSVDHAYSAAGISRGAVTVVGRVLRVPGAAGSGPTGCSGGHRVELVIGDSGRWKEPSADPGDRGRGLQMIGAFVDAFEVTRARTGTTVTVRQVLDCLGRAAR